MYITSYRSTSRREEPLPVKPEQSLRLPLALARQQASRHFLPGTMMLPWHFPAMHAASASAAGSGPPPPQRRPTKAAEPRPLTEGNLAEWEARHDLSSALTGTETSPGPPGPAQHVHGHQGGAKHQAAPEQQHIRTRALDPPDRLLLE